MPELQKRKIGLAAISYDSPQILKEFADRKGITFPLLSDTDSKAILAYGIFNEAMKQGTFAYGVPLPGTLVLDRSGRIIAKFAEADYKERVTVTSILDHQFGAPVVRSAVPFTAKHVTVTAAAAETVAASGQKITLSLEGTLPARMHVYAPGVKGYKPVEWLLEDSAAIKSGDVEFPKPEMLRLEVIQETVPVYQGQFRLRRDVVLAQPNVLQPLLDSNGDLTIRGSFRYQACDDKECYLPETVPVRWKLHWEAFDRERVSDAVRHK